MRARHLLLCSSLFACAKASAPAVSAVPPAIASSSSAAVAAPAAPPEPESRPQKLTADTKLVTKLGTSFEAPAAWTATTRPSRITVVAPEGDLQLTVIDVTAGTAEEAITAAWTAVDPTMKRNINVSHAVPARRGWDERRAVLYMVSPNEKRVVTALALRHNDAWSVLLLDGSQGTFEKRMGQVALVGQSLAPVGYVRESFAGKTPKSLDASAIARIVDLVEEGRQALAVPGVALALIQDGKVVYSGGLGVRELGKKAKVTEHTRFMIASNTKAMTTMMLAKLVDEGRFAWDTPVTKLDPSFKLGDDEVTSLVQVKHLICACTGLPRQDLEWLFEYAQRTPASSMQQLATMMPTSRFGEVFQYSNLMAAAGGYVAGAAVSPGRELGAAYDELMQTRVFKPLGMRETTFVFKKALAAEHAMPHGFDVDANVVAEDIGLNLAVVPVRPAGGAWSSLADMSRYVQLELAKGVLPNGKRWITAVNVAARAARQVAIGDDEIYGMGLRVDSAYGTPVVHHGGDLIGYHSDMFWLPEAQVGGIILTNADAGVLLRGPFMRRTLEVLFDGREEAREDLLSAATRMKEQIAKTRKTLVVPAESSAVADLAERYVSADLGSLVVRKSGEATILDFGEWKSPVASRKNEDGTVSLITIQPGASGFELVVDKRDGKRALVLRDPQHEHVFTEVTAPGH